MNQKNIVRLLAAASAVTLFMAYAPQAKAQSDFLSDILAVYGPDGNIVNQVSVWESTEDANTIYYIPDDTLANPSEWGDYTMLYENGGNANSGPWSDIIGVANEGGSYYLAFMSDTEASPVTGYSPVNGRAYEENPEGMETDVDVTYLLNPDLVAQGYTAKFIDDPVPEPSTFALAALGIAGLMICRRRK